MERATLDKPPQRRWWIAAIAVAVAIGVAVWLIIASTGAAEPRLNEPTHVLAKFVSTRTFDKMPYEKQRLYYKMLDDRGTKEIDHAFKSGQISQSEYRTALDSAWLGKHINRTEKYVAMSGGARAAYINDLLDKKFKKEAEKKPSASAGGDDEDDEIDADETAAELKVESWPAEVRQHWKLFHDTYRRERKAREAAATKPAGV
jgi:hypothetical protein